VAPIITGMTKQMFHIRLISILKFLYFNFFSDSFCIAFLSDGIATFISKQTLPFFARTSLSVYTPWFHTTVFQVAYSCQVFRLKWIDLVEGLVKLLMFWQICFGGKIDLIFQNARYKERMRKLCVFRDGIYLFQACY
jgi:hypothetical protein